MRNKFFKSLIALLSVCFVGVGASSCLSIQDLEQKIKLPAFLEQYKGAFSNWGDFPESSSSSSIEDSSEGGSSVGDSSQGGSSVEDSSQGGSSVEDSSQEDKNVSVTLPSSPIGYRVAGATTATKGESYQFTVTILEGFEKSAGFAVKVNGQTVTSQTDTYTVTVTDDLVITVVGVSVKTYTVTLPEGTGYFVEGNSSANHGSAYSFTVNFTQGYEAGADFKVKVNGTEVTSATYTYNVDVTGNITVTVEGVQLKNYDVSIPTGDGYTVAGETSVQHGASYSFTVSVDENVYDATNLVVKVNDVPVALKDGKYTVANVSEDLNIMVDGVARKTYAVSLPTGTGYTVSGESTASHGLQYVLRVSLASGYEKGANFAVKANGAIITSANDIYTVENVTGALTITVEGVLKSEHIHLGDNEHENTDNWWEVNYYTVTPPAGEGFTFTGAAQAKGNASYEFTVTVDETAFDASALVVKVNGEAVEATAGKYVVENVKADLVITVEGVLRKGYAVTLPVGTGYTVDGKDNVQHGANYEFTVSLDNGYEKGASFKVLVNGNVLTSANDIYTVENVTGALTITVEGVLKSEHIHLGGNEHEITDNWWNPTYYTVNTPTGEGFTFAGLDKVKAGESYTFTVSPAEGYEATVKVNGEEVNLVDGKYTVASVSEDLVITVDVQLKSYTVSLPTGDGFTVDGEKTVKHGATYTFTVAITEGYTNAVVKVNGEVVNPVDGKYSVTATKNLAVTVEVELKSYSVSLPTGDGFTVAGETTVKHGESYTFTVAIMEGYTNATVKVNGEVVSPVDGNVTVANVTKNIEITVEGVEKITYSVSLPTGDGFTVAGEKTVKHGESYTFTVAITEGYTNATVKVDGEVVSPVDGKYTVANVTKNLAITVEGVEKITYTVSLPAGTGFKVEGEKTVKHGESYTFKVTFDEGYNTAVVMVDGAVVIPDADGNVTVENVTANVVITVSGVQLNVYNVTKPTESEGFTFVGADSVEHGQSYTFEVSVKEGYTNAVVKANGEAVDLVDGKYIVANVTGNLTITVEGVALKTYAVSVSKGAGYEVGINATATHGVPFEFTVSINDGYEKGASFKVLVNGNVLTSANDTYTVVSVSGDLTITVEGVLKSEHIHLGENEHEITDNWWNPTYYTVNTPTGEGFTFAGLDKVKAGASYSFTVSPAEGYEATVKVNGNEVNLVDGKYTVASVSEDLVITVDVQLKSYTVSWPTGEGFTVAGEKTVKHGATYTFTVAITEGYTNATVKVNGEVVNPVDGKYSVTATKNLAITVEGVEKITYSVSLPTGEGFTVAGETTVKHGENYTFTVAITEGYTNAVVKVDGEVVNPVEGKYTVANVTKNIEITVEGVEKIAYTVSLPTGEGFTVDGATTVQHGATYTFTVAITEGYTNATVKVDGKVVNLVEGKYTVANVTKNIEITVEGVEAIVYTVTAPLVSEGFGFTGESTVPYGGDYTFTVVLNEGYTNSQSTVKVNGSALTGSNGEYTVENVMQNLEITVEGVVLNVYSVDKGTELGYTLTGESTVQHGATYTFTVSVNDGLTKSESFKVMVNGEAVEADNNTYTVLATSDLKIVVLGIAYPDVDLGENEHENDEQWWAATDYTVTFPEAPVGYTVSGEATVGKGEDYSFTVSILEGYEKSEDFKVMVNGAEVTSESNAYTVKATQNLKIVVLGVVYPGGELNDTENENQEQFWTETNN